MTTDLLSSAPAAYSALLGLVQTAAAALSPPVAVIQFELEEYVPGSYVLLTGIENHRFEWEALGSFLQKETYSLSGRCSVYVGDSPNSPSSTVPTDVMTATYTLFQAAVMTPVITNHGVPILGVDSVPAPYMLLPEFARYNSGPGFLRGGQAGWYGEIAWSYSLSALTGPM